MLHSSGSCQNIIVTQKPKWLQHGQRQGITNKILKTDFPYLFYLFFVQIFPRIYYHISAIWQAEGRQLLIFHYTYKFVDNKNLHSQAMDKRNA